MAEARCRERSADTCALLALTANVHRDHRQKPAPYKLADFNPYLRQRQLSMRRASIQMLR